MTVKNSYSRWCSNPNFVESNKAKYLFLLYIGISTWATIRASYLEKNWASKFSPPGNLYCDCYKTTRKIDEQFSARAKISARQICQHTNIALDYELCAQFPKKILNLVCLPSQKHFRSRGVWALYLMISRVNNTNGLNKNHDVSQLN